MTDQMPQVNAEFGTTPVIEFPTPEAPKGLKVVELTEGDGPIVRRGDTVTVNYHGVVWGKDTRLVVSIPPEYGYGSRGIPQAGIGGEDTLVFVIDIISTR